MENGGNGLKGCGTEAEQLGLTRPKTIIHAEAVELGLAPTWRMCFERNAWCYQSRRFLPESPPPPAPSSESYILVLRERKQKRKSPNDIWSWVTPHLCQSKNWWLWLVVYMDKLVLTTPNSLSMCIKDCQEVSLRYYVCSYLAECCPWWCWRARLDRVSCARARNRSRDPVRAPRCQTCHSFCRWIWPGDPLRGGPRRSSTCESESRHRNSNSITKTRNNRGWGLTLITRTFHILIVYKKKPWQSGQPLVFIKRVMWEELWLTHAAVTFIYTAANANWANDAGSWQAAALHLSVTWKLQSGSLQDGHTHNGPVGQTAAL